jgi:hypothetical protein
MKVRCVITGTTLFLEKTSSSALIHDRCSAAVRSLTMSYVESDDPVRLKSRTE